MSIRIISSGGRVPFQADGFIDNDWGFYYRDRHGTATLKVSPVREHNEDGTPALTFTRGMCDQFPGPYDAYWSASTEVKEFMGEKTFPEVFPELLKNLERHPYLFWFPGKTLHIWGDWNGDEYHLTDWEADDPETTYPSWGLTAQEAWESLRDRNFTPDPDEPEGIFEALEISAVPSDSQEPRDYTGLSLPPQVTEDEVRVALEVKG